MKRLFLNVFFSCQTTSLFILNQSILDMVFYAEGLKEWVPTSTHWCADVEYRWISYMYSALAVQRGFYLRAGVRPRELWITAGRGTTWPTCILDMTSSVFLFLIGLDLARGTSMDHDSSGDQLICRLWLTQLPLWGCQLQGCCGYVTFKNKMLHLVFLKIMYRFGLIHSSETMNRITWTLRDVKKIRGRP